MLARALCQEPELLVLDEPTSFLDIRHKMELLTILKEMVKTRELTVVMSLHELDLAQKISDYLVCIHNNKVEKYGTPEEIFKDGYVEQLYGVTSGSYHAKLGCMELEAVQGTPEVFVIGGNGSGIPVYRSLQRAGVPFAAGILQENDIDYAVAGQLAAKVIVHKEFTPVDENTYQKAKSVMETCQRVICCVEQFYEGNRYNERLKNDADSLHLLE
jgi:iron complex transport system ATP-binding protein